MYKPKTRRSRLIAAAIVLLALGGVAVGLYLDSHGEEVRVAQSRQERMRLAREDSAALKVAVMPTLDCLPLYVAREHHLFDSLGADVRLKAFRAQMDCDTALAGGSVEGAMTDLVRAEWMQGEGTPLTYLSATEASWQLASARAARVTQLKQLYDKMLAVTRHSATDLLATFVVDSTRLKDERVFRVQVNDVTVRLDMMLNGEMDAALLPEPQASAVRLAKGHVLLDTRRLDWRLGVLVFRTPAANDEGRKKQIDVLCRAYNQACDSLNKHGLAHYASLIASTCKVRQKVAEKLPRDIRFSHIAAPRPADVERAQRWLARMKEENIKENNRIK